MIDKITFQNQKINELNLIEFGFKKIDDYYKYEVVIIDNQFLLTIIIKDNVVMTDAIEISTNEKYMPYYIVNSNGNFVGNIRKEYDDIIEKIKKKCCTLNIFKSEYSSLIIKYIKDKYGDELEYLWEKTPNNAIARNKNNNKWYLALLTINKQKLAFKENEMIEIIDLLAEPLFIEKTVDNKKYFLGYHMNKKHWLTIKLDGSVDINEIYGLIDKSYELSISK